MSSATPQIVKGTTLDSDNVSYAAVKINSAGGKNARLNYAGNRGAFYLSTPLMMTWGVNEYTDEKTGKRSYDLSLQFPNDEYINDEQRTFLENVSALESKIKSDAVTNSKEWFNKGKMSAEVVDALWTPMVRYPKDRDTGEIDTSRAPALRVKLPFWDEQFSTEVYDLEGNALFPAADGSDSRTPVDLITKGSQIAAVIQNGGIWFANGKFGTTWKLFQVVVKPRATLRGKCQITLSSSDKSHMERQAAEADAAAGGGASGGGAVAEDTDDSASEGEADESAPSSPAREPTPPPPVKKVKKVVRRAKAQ